MPLPPDRTATLVRATAQRFELHPAGGPDPVERTITGLVVWSDGVPASDAELVLHGAAREKVELDAAGRFRVTLPYGARFTLRAKGRREFNGRMRESWDVSTDIGRNDRDRDVRLVLRVPQ